jgi:hypothetical protein
MCQSICLGFGVGEEGSHLSRRHFAVSGVCRHFRFVSGLPTGDVRSSGFVNFIKACL